MRQLACIASFFICKAEVSTSIHAMNEVRSNEISTSMCSVIQLCLILCDPMDYGLEAPLSMGFSRQESWSGLPCPSPGDLPDPRIEPRSSALQADSLLSESAAFSVFTGASHCKPAGVNRVEAR